MLSTARFSAPLVENGLVIVNDCDIKPSTWVYLMLIKTKRTEEKSSRFATYECSARERNGLVTIPLPGAVCSPRDIPVN